MVCEDCKKIQAENIKLKDKLEEVQEINKKLNDMLNNGNYIEVFPLVDGIVRISAPTRKVMPDGTVKIVNSQYRVPIRNIEILFDIASGHPIDNTILNHADIKFRLIQEHRLIGVNLDSFQTNRSRLNFPYYYHPIKVLQAWGSLFQPSGGGPNSGVKRLSDNMFGDSPDNMTRHYKVNLKKNEITVVD